MRDWIPWLLAARPKTLTTAVAPIAIGTALAKAQGYPILWGISFWALASALWIQIGTNLVNDALDFKKGADTDKRLGPVRATQMGWLSIQQVMLGAFLSFCFALFFGIPLILQGGMPLLIVLSVSVLCGYLYTGGPMPLAYHGLGDLFVIIFFGFVSTLSLFYLHSGTLSIEGVVAGAQIGLLATAILAVNNFRDYYEDEKSNKRTLVVRLGKSFGRLEIAFCALMPFALSGIWFAWGYTYAAILPLLTFPLASLLVRSVYLTEPCRLYNKFLGLSALLHLLFGLLLALGLWLQ